jgi:hypothetical protein
MLSLCPASVLGSLAPPRGEPLRPRHLSTTVCARGPVHEPRECERETRTPYGRTPICVPPPPSLAHACSARVRRRSAACRALLVRLSSTLRCVPAPSRAAPSIIPCASLQAVRTAAILSTVCHQRACSFACSTQHHSVCISAGRAHCRHPVHCVPPVQPRRSALHLPLSILAAILATRACPAAALFRAQRCAVVFLRPPGTPPATVLCACSRSHLCANSTSQLLHLAILSFCPRARSARLPTVSSRCATVPSHSCAHCLQHLG